MAAWSQSRQIRTLWVAVAFLGVALAASQYSLHNARGAVAASSLPTASCQELLADPWQGLSLEEKVERADAVLIVKLEPSGSRLKAIATDVILRSPGSSTSYRVGEEVPVLSRDAGTGTDWGDGAVALLEGPPASIKESYGTRQGRVPGLGDLRVEEFRRLASAR